MGKTTDFFLITKGWAMEVSKRGIFITSGCYTRERNMVGRKEETRGSEQEWMQEDKLGSWCGSPKGRWWWLGLGRYNWNGAEWQVPVYHSYKTDRTGKRYGRDGWGKQRNQENLFLWTNKLTVVPLTELVKHKPKIRARGIKTLAVDLVNLTCLLDRNLDI